MSEENTMRLNTLAPAVGAKTSPKRLGRGIGSGLGKTCGRGHKGQRARKSGNVAAGFEGGQMPLQRRVPKFGFVSKMALETAHVRLSELKKVKEATVDMQALRAANIIGEKYTRARIFLSGTLEKPVNVKGIKVTKGAKAAIEALGGKVEE